MGWNDSRREERVKAMERFLIVAATAVLFPFSGCGNMLDRPAPAKAEYIADYLEYFDGSQIEKLDYTYKGAIGGAFTVGRAKFKSPVELRDDLVETRVKAGLVTEGTYDPVEMAKEPALMQFRQELEVHAGGTIPSWFDFPFDRKMRMIREASEGKGGVSPRYEKVWYIDDERNVVYIRGNWG
jgi:hypothetical protein